MPARGFLPPGLSDAYPPSAPHCQVSGRRLITLNDSRPSCPSPETGGDAERPFSFACGMALALIPTAEVPPYAEQRCRVANIRCAILFNDLVRSEQYRSRNCDSQALRGFQIDHYVKGRRLLHRKRSRILTIGNLVYIVAARRAIGKDFGPNSISPPPRAPPSMG